MLPGIIGSDPATIAANEGTTDRRRVRKLMDQEQNRKLEEMVQRHLDEERRLSSARLTSGSASSMHCP